MRLNTFLNENTTEDILIYRAMSKIEAMQTIKDNKPHFISRYKWFSPNLEFVKLRVKDGKFNNSAFSKDKYTHILEFSIEKNKFTAFFKRLNKNEYMLDRRNTQNIKWKNIHVL